MGEIEIESMEDAVNLFSIKTSHYLLAGVSIVAALSWNDSIKSIIDKKFPKPSDEISVSIIYSVIITCILILLIYCLPNTKSELPAETRHRLNMTEMEIYKKQMNKELSVARDSIHLLQKQIAVLQTTSTSSS
jgi:hypothetical protein